MLLGDAKGGTSKESLVGRDLLLIAVRREVRQTVARRASVPKGRARYADPDAPWQCQGGD